jgi:hypothetical protein
MLNKLKNIFMADKVIPRGKEWPDERQGVLPEDWQPSEELKPLESEIDTDPEYLQHSAEAVGFQNRSVQWELYRIVTSFIPEEKSILDFGCARGDYKLFYSDEYKEDINYIGIDLNQNLINAGLEAYDNKIDIRCENWFSLDDNLKMDWCINIRSNNLRYDANIKESDEEYLKNTIQSMYNHSNEGLIILLDNSIHNPGNIFNWAHEQFAGVSIDHSFSNDEYILIIYK